MASSREDKDRTHKRQRLTNLCFTFRDKGHCNKGSRCQFVHDGQETEGSLTKYNKVCYDFLSQRSCAYGQGCKFSHDLDKFKHLNSQNQQPEPDGKEHKEGKERKSAWEEKRPTESSTDRPSAQRSSKDTMSKEERDRQLERERLERARERQRARERLQRDREWEARKKGGVGSTAASGTSGLDSAARVRRRSRSRSRSPRGQLYRGRERERHAADGRPERIYDRVDDRGAAGAGLGPVEWDRVPWDRHRDRDRRRHDDRGRRDARYYEARTHRPHDMAAPDRGRGDLSRERSWGRSYSQDRFGRPDPAIDHGGYAHGRGRGRGRGRDWEGDADRHPRGSRDRSRSPGHSVLGAPVDPQDVVQLPRAELERLRALERLTSSSLGYDREPVLGGFNDREPTRDARLPASTSMDALTLTLERERQLRDREAELRRIEMRLLAEAELLAVRKERQALQQRRAVAEETGVMSPMAGAAGGSTSSAYQQQPPRSQSGSGAFDGWQSNSGGHGDRSRKDKH